MRYSLDTGLSFRRKQKLTLLQRLKGKLNLGGRNGVTFTGVNGAYIGIQAASTNWTFSMKLQFLAGGLFDSFVKAPLTGVLLSSPWYEVSVLPNGSLTWGTTVICPAGKLKTGVDYELTLVASGGTSIEVYLDGKSLGTFAVDCGWGPSTVGANFSFQNSPKFHLYEFSLVESTLTSDQIKALPLSQGLVSYYILCKPDGLRMAASNSSWIFWLNEGRKNNDFPYALVSTVGTLTSATSTGNTQNFEVTLTGLDANGFNYRDLDVSSNTQRPELFIVTTIEALPEGVSVYMYRSANRNYLRFSSISPDPQTFTATVVIQQGIK